MPIAALNTAAGSAGPAPVPSMAYMAPNGNGALSLNAQQPNYTQGVDPTGILALMNAPPGPESPYARKLSDASDALMGDPKDIAGALDTSRGNYDKAVAGKMTAINRAMARLSGLGQGQVNLPLLAGAAGALQPSGSLGQTLGNAFNAAIPQIEKQRAIERQLAGSMDNLDVAGADTGIDGARGDEGFLEKRIDLADKYASQAGNVQNRADLNNARTRQSVLQYAGRIGAADISANKNRYQFIGSDPQDPMIGRYLDKSTGNTVAGPAATGTGAGATAGGVAKWKYNMYLASHPGDSAGALDYVAGHKNLTPQQMRSSALSLAQKELGVGADPEEINTRAQQIYDSVNSGFGDEGGGSPEPASAHAAPATGPAPQSGDVVPTRPQGIPPAASYSPSKKQWWWKLPDGKWAHS